jgi:hypothetical protein
MHKKKVLLLLVLGVLAFALGIVGMLLLKHYGLKELVAIVGYPGVFAIVFAESGLFLVFLARDSLIVTTGLLASGIL